MACTLPLPHVHFILLLFLLPFSSVAQTNGTVNIGASITATDKATPWLLPSKDFAFGFKQLQDKNLFLLSIWYYKIPDQTVVWYANQGVPVPRGSKVQITPNKGLVLSDPQGKELWTSQPILNQVAYGFMNDTGNFVLVSGDSVSPWESFKYPTDTLLPTQIMESGGVLVSRQTEMNFSMGRFQFRLLGDGNLVLNTRDLATNFAYEAYYWSNTYDGVNITNRGYQVIFNVTGYIYVLIRNNQRKDLTPRMVLPSSDYYHRATLNFDGVFTQYYHPKTLTGNPNWTPLWSAPDNICVDIVGSKGRGACGFNSICTLNEDSRPGCSCPEGFSWLDPNDKYGDCKPSFTPSCEEADNEDLYDLSVLMDTDWPTSDYELLKPSNEEMCRKSCLQDCFCAVSIFRDGSCWKKKLPLSNGRKDSSVSGKAFMKFRKGGTDLLPPPTTDRRSPFTKKKDRTLIVVGSVLLGGSLFLNFVLTGSFCLGFFLHHKKIVNGRSGGSVGETNLRCFTYKELVEATNGFKEELGRGAFGIVYKGVVEMGNSKNSAAVKKLDMVVQEREREFRTEVHVIGQTHHKNLVRLLGFCDEGEHRMLVYECLNNGTLASYLFGVVKPSWNQRSQIALGISRGLLYLHEECSTQIIHCDIKPQNILLDDCYNARISDFGLAKLLLINQSQTNTGIRGTKGYVAPEWFRNRPITAKVDVYSFGVLLLEIISCRRSVEDLGEERAILTDWACDCFLKERLNDLVKDDMEALDDWKKLERFVMVGIWCIQEDPSLRPTMRKVAQMLEGVVDVDVPPCPSQFSFFPASMATTKGVVNVGQTEEEAAKAVAEYVANLSCKYAEERGKFTVVVAGGSLISTLRKLTEDPYLHSVDWSKWHLFWVDERLVPLTDKESNYKLAYDGFLSKVPIPPSNIHAVNVTLPVDAAAEDYETLIKNLVNNKTIDFSTASGFPKFDVILLGMGLDGHVASLFMGHPLLHEKKRLVAAVKDSPYAPKERVTFTFPVIDSASNLAFVITASNFNKWAQVTFAKLVEKAVNGGGQGGGEELPVQMVKPEGQLNWFLDKTTAANL